MAAIVGGFALTYTPAWRWLRHACTYTHELAHAITAILVGGVVHSVVYHPDSSGVARFSIPREFGSIRLILATGAGYLGPGVAGLATVSALVSGMVVPWLVLCAGLVLIGLLLMVRNVWGLLYSTILGGGLVAVAASLEPVWATGIGGVAAGVLLAGGVRMAYTQYSHTDLTSSDAETIAGVLHVPGRAVAAIQVLFAIGFLGTGLWLGWIGAWSV